MYCQNCGSIVSNGESFCPSCGAQVVSDSPGVTYPSPSAPGKLGKNKLIGLIAVGAIAVAAAIIIIIIISSASASGSWEKAAEKLANAISKRDADAIIDLMPDEYIEYLTDHELTMYEIRNWVKYSFFFESNIGEIECRIINSREPDLNEFYELCDGYESGLPFSPAGFLNGYYSAGITTAQISECRIIKARFILTDDEFDRIERSYTFLLVKIDGGWYYGGLIGDY